MLSPLVAQYVDVGQGFNLPVLAWQAPTSRVDSVNVIIHGLTRTLSEGFVFDSGAATSANALIAVPLFEHSGRDSSDTPIQPNSASLRWDKSNGYIDNSNAANAPSISSYTALDNLLINLTTTYPAATSIHLIGFSAGAQFLNRYAAVSDTLPTLHGVRLIFGSASSWLYLDSTRADPSLDPAQLQRTDFRVPDPAPKAYDAWKYGLQNAPVPASVARARVLGYATTLISVRDDTKTTNKLDGSDAAAVQGTQRFVRGETYRAYLEAVWGMRVEVARVDEECGHNAVRAYQNINVTRAIFGGGDGVGAAMDVEEGVEAVDVLGSDAVSGRLAVGFAVAVIVVALVVVAIMRTIGQKLVLGNEKEGSKSEVDDQDDVKSDKAMLLSTAFRST
ncbi:hypothetical protein BC830DRAFT_821603 [Chytriomyces sp. MP71]|nr:hypothetical protein BC830DRAFT_821603 [Chytriomyces sp. MP71]